MPLINKLKAGLTLNKGFNELEPLLCFIIQSRTWLLIKLDRLRPTKSIN
jgi:hypothetical protein